MQAVVFIYVYETFGLWGRIKCGRERGLFQEAGLRSSSREDCLQMLSLNLALGHDERILVKTGS